MVLLERILAEVAERWSSIGKSPGTPVRKGVGLSSRCHSGRRGAPSRNPVTFW